MSQVIVYTVLKLHYHKWRGKANKYESYDGKG